MEIMLIFLGLIDFVSSGRRRDELYDDDPLYTDNYKDAVDLRAIPKDIIQDVTKIVVNVSNHIEQFNKSVESGTLSSEVTCK